MRGKPDRLRFTDAEWRALVLAVVDRENAIADRDEYHIASNARETAALKRALAKIREVAHR